MKMKELVIFFLKTIGIFKFKGERWSIRLNTRRE
jgi:hypothetical protein